MRRVGSAAALAVSAGGRRGVSARGWAVNRVFAMGGPSGEVAQSAWKRELKVFQDGARREYRVGNSLFGRVSFNLADIGEGIAEVEIREWFVKQGQRVQKFDKLCEVESDKATVEITSKYNGVVAVLHVPQGGVAKVGKPLVDFDEVVGAGEEAPNASAKKQASASAPLSAESSKTASAATAVATSSASSAKARKESWEVLATPAVRRIARERNLDLRTVEGSGRDGRIMKEDVMNLSEEGSSVAAESAPPSSSSSRASAVVAGSASSSSASAPVPGSERVEPLRPQQRAMVKTMTLASTVPQFLFCDEVSMDALMNIREHLKSVAAERKVKLTYMPFFVKAASIALKEFPILNSSLSANKDALIYKEDHNIGIAMDTAKGLLVPNVKRVQDKSVYEISQELNALQQLGKAGKLGPNELSGGTFTLSNIGTVGGTYVKPILMVPEVAIGGLSRVQVIPKYDKSGALKPSNILYVSWSADHRVIDGVTIARFSNLWKSLLENPPAMLLDLK